MKKKVILICALVVSLACAVGGTMAYFVAKDTAHNVITSGNIDIEIKEYDKDGQPYPTEPIEVMPGKTVDKVVKVQNVEPNQTCWVRAKINPVIEVPKLDENGKPILDKDGKPVMEKLPTEGVLTITGTDSSWVKGNDGYYYYTLPVQPEGSEGNITKALMTKVSFDAKNMGNQYQNATVTVSDYAQAVQYVHNEGKYEDGELIITSIKGWPAENQQ